MNSRYVELMTAMVLFFVFLLLTIEVLILVNLMAVRVIPSVGELGNVLLFLMVVLFSTLIWLVSCLEAEEE